MILRKSETEQKWRTEKKSRREIIAVLNEDNEVSCGLMVCWVVAVEKKKKKKKKEKKQKKNWPWTELLIILHCNCLVFKIVPVKKL